MNSTIPKKIHYCWFGGNPLPELAEKCLLSWKKYLPDYEIVKWDESNFDVSCCDYVREAYEAKKWAFVSDYARFKILYENGGLYFDTDVEIIKPLDDIVLKGSFMGRERESGLKKGPGANPGLGLGAAPGLDLYKEILESYEKMRFKNDDGSFNLKTIVDYTTEILVRHGLSDSDEIQMVGGVFVYPKEYFCPIDYSSGEMRITDNTRSIHHYSASWHGEKEKYAANLQRKLYKIFPKRFSEIAGVCVATLKFEGFFGLLKGVLRKIK